MKFAPTKCFVMSITLKNSPFRFSYFLCNAQVDGARHQKYLGVYITCTLCWQLQCEEAKQMAMRVLGILQRNLSPVDLLRNARTYPYYVRLLNTPQLLNLRIQRNGLTLSNPFSAALHVLSTMITAAFVASHLCFPI